MNKPAESPGAQPPLEPTELSPPRPDAASERHPFPLEPGPEDRDLLGAYRSAARQTISRLAARPGRAAGLAPFDELLAGEDRLRELGAAAAPVVGSVCNFVPEELVLAAGAIPLRVEIGLPEAARAGARAVCADLCPAVRCLIGAHLGQLPQLSACDLLVIPSACDGKKKLARSFGAEPEVFLLELPLDKDSPAGQDRWREQISLLARRLERLTGGSLKRGALRQAVERLNRRSQLARRLAELRQQRPGLIAGADAFLVLQASFLADPAWWEEKTALLLEELVGLPAPATPPPLRVLLAGSPILFPDFRLLELIEASGASLVADLMCSAGERLYHPHVVDEWTVPGLIRGAADRTLRPSACPCFVSDQDRIDRLLELYRSSGAQGVIHHTLRLCQPFDLELPRLAAALRRRGIPLLDLHAEPDGDGSGTMRNRVEAFLEMLELGRD